MKKMLCSFPFSTLVQLLLLPKTTLLLIAVSSFPFVFSITHATPPNKTLHSTSTMDPLELETLFKIMDTLSSDHNFRLSFPNPCHPTSSWPGIECKHLHVTRLDFGTPPNPTCKNSATFPPEIFHLPHLESIFIFHCFTHTPTKISLTNTNINPSPLQQLSLRSNPALVGTIPPLISSLKSLQILTLSQNKLTGRIPDEILGLNSLLHLDLSYNELTGPIPDDLGSLRDLVGLDLSYNELEGPIPSSVGELGVLQKLDLSSNSLSGKIPDTIGRLQSLVFLALSNNRLRGGFPRELGALQSLQYFLMDANPTMRLVSLPVGLGRLRKLQEVRLSDSGYSGAIPAAYSELGNLSSLSLQNNRLSGRIPAGFANLSHIYHMNLSRNLLEGEVPFDSVFLKRLGRNLDLSGNPGLLCFEGEDVICGRSNISSVGKNKSEAPPPSDISCCSMLLSVTAAIWILLSLCI